VWWLSILLSICAACSSQQVVRENKTASGNVIAAKKIEDSIVPRPSIQIVQPANDKIINYGDRIRFIANAVDGAGNFPVVVWAVKHNNVERVLGVGSELETDRLDIGYNTIIAYTIDFTGSILFASPVHIMIPYQAIKTRIELPKNNQIIEWNQPVLFYARGNELEYALTDVQASQEEASFLPGSGFFVESLPPGQYRVSFRGKFGTADHVFTVKDRLRDIAAAARIEGYVLMSGKQGEWHPVKTGDKIPEGYIIRAIGNGLAEIHLNNGVVYILNQGNAIRILANGNIVKNMNQEELALYSLVDPENIREVQKNLKPLIGSLEQLLKNHEIVELKSENKEDILHLLDLIFKGQLKIDEVTIE
jgi:hypothetical protein